MFLVTIITRFTPSKYSNLDGRYSLSGICGIWGETLVCAVSQNLQTGRPLRDTVTITT